MENVFVYGSLKRGHGNHYYMEAFVGGEFVREHTTKDQFDLKALDKLPVLIPGSCKIKGEIYSVPQDGMDYLDHLESNGRFYLRSVFEECWIYMLNPPLIRHVEEFLTNKNVSDVGGIKSWSGL